jgi:hypothetical protein
MDAQTRKKLPLHPHPKNQRQPGTIRQSRIYEQVADMDQGAVAGIALHRLRLCPCAVVCVLTNEGTKAR